MKLLSDLIYSHKRDPKNLKGIDDWDLWSKKDEGWNCCDY